MTNATPRPWVRGKGADAEYIIAKGGEWPDKRIAEIYYECGRRGGTTREERSANADLIVTAVNAHETLVIACTFAAEELNSTKSLKTALIRSDGALHQMR